GADAKACACADPQRQFVMQGTRSRNVPLELHSPDFSFHLRIRRRRALHRRKDVSARIGSLPQLAAVSPTVRLPIVAANSIRVVRHALLLSPPSQDIQFRSRAFLPAAAKRNCRYNTREEFGFHRRSTTSACLPAQPLRPCFPAAHGYLPSRLS